MTTTSTFGGNIWDDESMHQHILKLARSGTASVTDIKTQWDKVVRQTRRKPMTITCNGKPKAVLMSPADYQRIAVLVEALIEKEEDAEDFAAILARQNEPDIPFDTVTEDLIRRGIL